MRLRITHVHYLTRKRTLIHRTLKYTGVLAVMHLFGVYYSPTKVVKVDVPFEKVEGQSNLTASYDGAIFTTLPDGRVTSEVLQPSQVGKIVAYELIANRTVSKRRVAA
jgi:hypothetical protein